MEKDAQKTQQNSYYYRLAFRIAADFGITLAAPAVLAAFLGQWLDKKWGTDPWLLFVCLVAAFTLTAIFVVRKAKVYGKLYQDGPK
ncbi:AtpZ/AtpI family protein [Patescibacteria group bacterium]|nr:AtpZ/AtpI family protein [Patescibacteria group bacterium]